MSGGVAGAYKGVRQVLVVNGMHVGQPVRNCRGCNPFVLVCCSNGEASYCCL